MAVAVAVDRLEIAAQEERGLPETTAEPGLALVRLDQGPEEAAAALARSEETPLMLLEETEAQELLAA